MPTVRRNSWCGLAVAFAMQAARFRNIQLRGISTNAWMHSSPPIYMCVWVRQLDLFYRMDRCDTLETLSHVRTFTVKLRKQLVGVVVKKVIMITPRGSQKLTV